MKNFARSLAAALTLGTLGTACSSESGGDSGPFTRDNFADRMVSAYCDVVERCAETDLGLLASVSESGLITCEETFASLFGIQLRALVYELPDDVRIDQEGARRCLDMFESSCDRVMAGGLEQCFADIFIGTRPLGAPCGNDEECAPGFYCDEDAPDEGDACEGICATKIVNGSVCPSSSACESGNCEFDDEAGEYLCAASSGGSLQFTAELGAPCGEDTITPSGVETWCVDGLQCLENGAGDEVCQRPRKVGESCELPTDVCTSGNCGPDGRCKSLVVVATAPGAACGDRPSGEIILCDTRRGLVCLDEACVALGSGRGAEGAVCTRNGVQDEAVYLTPFCRDGLFCQLSEVEGEEGTCVKKFPVGTRCDGYSEGSLGEINPCAGDAYCVERESDDDADERVCMSFEDIIALDGSVCEYEPAGA